MSSREFVFGAFLSNAIDNNWTAGKKTAAELAFAAGKAELLREQIRDGVASCHGTEAVMVSPAPNSTLAARTVVFSWSAAANATGYRLDLGTTPGGTELITAFTTTTNVVITNLPCNGSTVHARLWTRVAQYGNPKDYAFRSCTNGGPLITTPAPGSTLTSASVNFTWSAIAEADFYRISVGSTLGGNDITAAQLSTNSLLVPNMPTDGRVIFVRLDAHVPAGWTIPNDFAYNNIASRTPAISTVLNAVTQRPNLSPGCLATLSGANFAEDVTVAVGGIRAQLSGAPTPTQIRFLIPGNLARGTYNVVIASGGASSPGFAVTLADSSPGVYEPLLDSSSVPVPPGRTFKPGDTLAVRAIGLGPLGADGRPALATRVTVGGVSAAVVSIASSAEIGVFQIAFRVPATLPSGAQRVVVIAGSESSNAAQLLIAGPAISGIVNGASFAGSKVAPGALVSIFGSDLGTDDEFGMYPKTLLPGSGVVTINGISAPLFDVVASAGQINLLVPFETPTSGAVPVAITNPLGSSSPFQLAMAPAAPGIFRLYDPANPKRANAAALVANTAWRVIPASMAAALDLPGNCKADRVSAAAICGEPAAPGDAVQIYVTGLGRATPNGNPVGNTLRTGDVAPADGSPLYRTVETPVVTIGGIDAPVAFSGIAPGFAGLYQVNVTVPAGVPAGDDIPVTITIGGASDTATIAIRR
jgi:uncharacterized protein (TIGR03437 family)